MKGMSARVSMTLSHLDLLLTMYQAIGKPRTTSIIETKMAIAKEAWIAENALFIKSGVSKICPIRFILRSIPRIGGIKITAKKKMVEDE